MRIPTALPDKIRVEDMRDWYEALPNEFCDVCGCSYNKHGVVPGFTWLRRLCNGDLIKI